jgi:hypothetical protein
MMSRSLVPILAALSFVFSTGQFRPALALETAASNETLAETIFRDIIDRTLEAAVEEIRGGASDDLDEYETWSEDASPEALDRLDRLNARHDRRLAKLDRELERDLRKAERDFARHTDHHHGPRKSEKHRAKYDRRVDKAYAKYDTKRDRANHRFAERRERILYAQYDG